MNWHVSGFWLCFSDDRSAEIFKTKIEAATQMKAVIGADPRPNCLVIDEIDGAPLVRFSSVLYSWSSLIWKCLLSLSFTFRLDKMFW